ncbi:MAG: hypothetical protein AAGC68_15695, partial [Verrucomicrobiota bacterium]
MNSYYKILKNISRPHWFDIVRLIKCSDGLSVGELAEELEMSYMGVKKHCLAMQKLGYLDTWRRPKEVGRPEKTYRVTERLNAIFPAIGDEVSLSILDAATQLEVNAAEKLLFAFFREQTERFAKKVTGADLEERARSLAAARADLGYFSEVAYSAEGRPGINEFHNPLEPLFTKYPTLDRMEVQMFEKLLSVSVERSASKVSGLTRYRF